MYTKPMIINVSGNIGAGKSSLLRRLNIQDDCMIVEEPVHLFTNYKGVNILEKFYKKTISNIEFQTTITRIMMDYHIKMYDECVRKGIKYMITERSIIDSIEIFSRMLISDETFYKSIYEYTSEYQSYLPSLYVYIQSKPDRCLERIVKRNRKEELNISLSYLENLHNCTERFFEKLSTQKKIIYNMENKSQSRVATDVSRLIQKNVESF